MKKIKIGSQIFLATWLFYIVYNSIYGWNKTPVDGLESALDGVSRVGFLLGAIFTFMPLYEIYLHFVKGFEERKKMEKELSKGGSPINSFKDALDNALKDIQEKRKKNNPDGLMVAVANFVIMGADHEPKEQTWEITHNLDEILESHLDEWMSSIEDPSKSTKSEFCKFVVAKNPEKNICRPFDKEKDAHLKGF